MTDPLKDRIGNVIEASVWHVFRAFGERSPVVAVFDQCAAVAQTLSCRLLGHSWVEDSCGLPEHDYCAWCGRRIPPSEVQRLGVLRLVPDDPATERTDDAQDG